MEYNKRLIRPKGLSRQNLHEIKDFAVSYKIDGEHRFLVLEKDKNPSLIDLNNKVTVMKELIWMSDKYVLEGEIYYHADKFTFYAFDIVYADGKDVSNSSFKDRYELLRNASCLSTLNFFKVKEFLFPVKNSSTVSTTVSTTVYSLLDKLDEKEPEFETDGLIFMPQDYGFFDKRASIYKWKPVEQLTADFLCLKGVAYCSMSIYQFKELRLYQIPKYKKEMPKYFPIEFTPFEFGAVSIHNTGESQINGGDMYHNKIVECVWKESKWEPYRIREDKTIAYRDALEKKEFTGPNNWLTCLQIYKDSLNPISLEEIKTFS